MLRMLTRAALALALVSTSAFAQQSEVDIWATLLKPKYFPDVELTEGRSIIDMKTPYRSEDAAFTPVSITAGIPQTAERYIEKLYVFVEKNPQPLVGVFTLTPEMGRADLAMRVRVDQYTNVRAVAVLNNGEHHMVTNFVKASGGCSAPLAADFDAAMERIGAMKFRTIGDETEDDLLIGQFMLSHPNITGMQKDQKTHLIRPEHYVKTIKLYHGDTLLMTAETGFSVSADPSFRFFFRDTGAHELRAEVVDSKGMSWEQQFDVPG
ncbi:MAG: quinoprotein dehydrogenase-associated SoxYZ-like carrier [Gammaproteobacteria bacterium]|nr:quinoprotein dehydrogenase-associated SoxYZ-like carrier [Gammaproteobacteria bacterium]MCP5201577.1 quinoprotein dehydrogenase-associated SoxYZ-like carrier [Gammaproteobacteria bacterium]